MLVAASAQREQQTCARAFHSTIDTKLAPRVRNLVPSCMQHVRQKRQQPDDTPMPLHISHQNVVLISSTSSSSLAKAQAKRFRDTVLERGLPAPLWYYHEDSYDRACNISRPTAQALLSHLDPRVASRVCAIDLFLMQPWLMNLLVRPDSCIDAYYRLAGNREPLVRSMSIQSGKLLVRKVAALSHAVMNLNDRSVALWLDFDVTFQSPSQWPSSDSSINATAWSELTTFVQQQDVTYLPFKPHVQPRATRALQPVDSWAIESGVLAVLAGQRTRALLRHLLQHYDGRAADLARVCTCADGVNSDDHHEDLRLCDQAWFADSLYLDDMWVWTLYMRADLRGEMRSLCSKTLAGSMLLGNLSHGWFGLHVATHQKAEHSAADCATPPYTPSCDSGCASWLGAATVCPGAPANGRVNVGGFNLKTLLTHNMADLHKAGPYTVLLQNASHVHSQLPEHLLMPEDVPGVTAHHAGLGMRPLLRRGIADCSRWRRAARAASHAQSPSQGRE